MHPMRGKSGRTARGGSRKRSCGCQGPSFTAPFRTSCRRDRHLVQLISAIESLDQVAESMKGEQAATLWNRLRAPPVAFADFCIAISTPLPVPEDIEGGVVEF